MSKTYNNRYLKDSDGEIYLPMTSVDCIIDIDNINIKINNLEELVKSQGYEIETLKERINKLESEGTK